MLVRIAYREDTDQLLKKQSGHFPIIPLQNSMVERLGATT